MKNVIILIFVFMLGFAARDIVKMVIPEAKASVSGMDYKDLGDNEDFQKAVKEIIQKKCIAVSGGVIACDK